MHEQLSPITCRGSHFPQMSGRKWKREGKRIKEQTCNESLKPRKMEVVLSTFSFNTQEEMGLIYSRFAEQCAHARHKTCQDFILVPYNRVTRIYDFLLFYSSINHFLSVVMHTWLQLFIMPGLFIECEILSEALAYLSPGQQCWSWWVDSIERQNTGL